MGYRNHSKMSGSMRKGIFVLPSLLTTGGMLLGFLSIIYTMDDKFLMAAWAIVGAGFFDSLDGRVARASGTTSRFGIEYDSMADLISFGVAPALLAFQWALRDFGRLGWLAAFLYVTCAALRLARFNLQVDSVESRIFRGLPTPAGGGTICSTVLFFETYGAQLPRIEVPLVGSAGVLLLVFLLDYLMISAIQYTSGKGSGARARLPMSRVTSMIVFAMLVIWQPEIMLFLIGIAYVSSGPLGIVPRARARRRAGGTWWRDPAQAADEGGGNGSDSSTGADDGAEPQLRVHGPA